MSAAQVAIPLLTLILAVPVGMEFPLAARVDCRDAVTTSARLYTADYLVRRLRRTAGEHAVDPRVGGDQRLPAGSGIESPCALVMLVRRG